MGSNSYQEGSDGLELFKGINFESIVFLNLSHNKFDIVSFIIFNIFY